MKKQIPFSTLLLRYFGVTVAAVMLVLGACAYVGLRWLAVELSDNLGERSAQLVQSRTYQYIDGVGAVARIVGGFQQSEADLGKNVADDYQALWRLLWSALRDTRAIEALYVADSQGNYVQVRRDPELVTRLIDRRASRGTGPGREVWLKRDDSYRVLGEEAHDGSFDPRTRPWFRDTQSARITYWSDVFVSTTSRQPVLAVTFPVIDTSGRVARVVGASVPLKRLNEFVVQARPTPASMVLLVNQRGEVLANAIGGTSRPALHGDRLARVEDLGVDGLAVAIGNIRPGLPSPVAIHVAGKPYQAYVKPFGGYDWTAMVLIPDADTRDELRDLLAIALGVIAAVFLGAVVALLRLSNGLSRPLTRLVAEANHIRAFELDAFNGVRSRIEEVAHLSAALESAVEALKGFKRYVPADLVRQLLASPEFARVGGREAELTVMFTDIFSFTSFAERLGPKELMSQISEYLELVTGVIMKHGGTVDKYIGDAVMAFWGAPQTIDDGPGRACRAALECQERLVELNANWTRDGRPVLITGIGINTARVVVGNFGSSDRLNYSLLGDGVNLAARLEKLNREYRTLVLLSESTQERTAGRFETRLVDSVVVRGRTQPVRVYELLRESGSVKNPIENRISG